MGLENLLLVGSSHLTAPLEILQDISFSPELIREHLPGMREELDLDEAVILSTCNRTEIYAAAENERRAAGAVQDWLLARTPGESGVSRENLYTRFGAEAASHLFRTASGLESLIIGETEIAGQVQDALEIARGAGTAQGFSTMLFSTAFRASKRSRTETEIAAGTTSVASASVHLAHRIFGDLSRRSALMIGAGETGRLVCRYLAHHGIGKLTIANRTNHRALEVAGEFGGEAAGLEGIGEILEGVDIAVAATHSPTPLITGEMIRAAMRNRSSRMLLLVDISMPANIEGAASSVDNVFLNDMNDLKSIVQRTLDRRSREIPAVERIIEGEMACYAARTAAMKAGPIIKELRQRYEDLAGAQLEKFSPKMSEEDRAVAARMVRDLTNKLLHWPTMELREIARDPEADPGRIEWLRRLFGLDKPLSGKGDG